MPSEPSAAQALQASPPALAPFRLDDGAVRDEWIDHNGHMNVAFYHLAFDQAAGRFFRWLGLDQAYRSRHHASTFALEVHLNYLRELLRGERFAIEALLLSSDAKRLHYCMQMMRAESAEVVATYESLSVHVDLRTRRSAPMPQELQGQLQAVVRAHAAHPRPWQVGRAVGAPLPAVRPS
jgi:acyl-CoA thioester hydrolase